MKLNIKINPFAFQDIKEARNYIKEQNINAIDNFMKQLNTAIENLAHFPDLGMELSKKIEIKTEYRYFVVDEYIIFYKYSNENLYIYRILNAKRDYMKILFGTDE